MRTVQKSLIALAVVLAAAPLVQAHGFFSVRLGIGIPIGPCWGPCWGYYRPYPVYVAPAPVVVQPAVVGTVPVYAAPAAPVAAAAAPAAPAPAAVGTPTAYSARAARPEQGDAWEELQSPDERTRAEAILRLARRKERRAVEPLQKALREDASPAVREAAARGLGLIGSPKGLSTLQDAAQSDDDRDVRRSASFSAEVIRTNLGRR
jgi:hypothetical protein